MKTEQLPWNIPPLDKWRIVGMNHYNMAGVKRLFVAMTDSKGRCIQTEGTDEIEVFRDLWKKANKFDAQDKLKGG
jgi:hypothetical protein